MKVILTALIFLMTISLSGQEYASTDSGKRVKLNNDGTWEYVQESSSSLQTSHIFIDGEKLISGVTEYIHTGNGIQGDDIKTSVTIAKEGEKTMIIFWQETSDCHIFPHSSWEGNVVLYLENSETIKLIDRGIKGHNKIENGYKPAYGSNYDLCQRYAAFYLTYEECQKLKKSNLSRVAYQLDDAFETGTNYMTVQENASTLKTQLSVIGK